MSKQIYVVYILYCNTMEQMYSYTDLDKTKAKRLELLHKWVNDDTFAAWAKEEEVNTNMPIPAEIYDAYYLSDYSLEDTAYVGIEDINLEE